MRRLSPRRFCAAVTVTAATASSSPPLWGLVSDRAAVRAEIKQDGEMRILWNAGDRPADLIGGFAEHRFQVPDPTVYQP